jgi:iron complex outermembrane receptor protein
MITARRPKTRRVRLMVSAAAIFACPVPAVAQEVPTDAPPATGGTDTASSLPEAAATSADGRTGPEIVVTGSRIARRDYTATSPIVTVDADLLEQSSAVSVEANLNKLPQFTPALTQFNTTDIQPNANNAIGASTVSLRQLGSNRNLVLLDGRRPTPINGAGVVDTNTIPSAAIQRVEVITGGASSTYGADAVGGVVNFILKNNFTGFDVDAQAGLSERGDGFEYRVSTLVGANLDGGRGNVILGIEHYDRKSIRNVERPWTLRNLRDPNIAGTEFFIPVNFVSVQGVPAAQPSQAALNALYRSKGSPAGIDIPRNSSIYLNDDGSTFINTSTRFPTSNGTYVPLFYGNTDPIDGLQTKLQSNGLRGDNNLDSLLSSPQDRWSFFSKGHYEVADHVKFVSQAYYARTQVRSVSLNNVSQGSFASPIPYNDNIYTGNAAIGTPSSILANGATNPDFLAGGKFGLNCAPRGGCTNRQVFPVPAEVKALLDSRTGTVTNPANPTGVIPGLPTTINARDNDWYANIIPSSISRRYTINNNSTFQVQAGFEGDFGGKLDWTWDISGSFGETIAKTDLYGLFSGDRFRSVVQAPNYGLNFSAVGNGTVPGANRNGATASCATGISPFRAQTYSDDCARAVRVDAQIENRLRQQIVEGNLQGGLFKLPYGDVRFAIGGDYRRNSIRFHADSLSTEGSSFYETVNGTFPQGSTAGSITVKEAYGELLIPLLSDLPLAQELSLDLGYRISDYNTIGKLSTYKLNGEYAPFSWLRFRGGYQRASRAPNLGEVFTARTQSQVAGLDGDPCSRGNTTTPVVYGNYSANTALNSSGARVEALCRQLMTTDAQNQYYRDGRIFPNGQGNTFVSQLLAGAGGLKEETASTYTIGAVLSAPTDNPWLRRLRLSVDYYNITLADGISQQGVDSVYRQCFSGLFNPEFTLNEACRRLSRDSASGEPILVTVNFSNLGRVETAGYDVQLDWGVRFADVGVGLPGAFSTNINFTYLDKFATTPDQVAIPLIDFAGTLGGGQVGTNAGSYRWKLFTRVNYSVGGFTAGVQWQHKPATADASSVTNTSTAITGAPAYDLFNINTRYAITKQIALRAGVDNLFDKAPPLIGVDKSVVAGDGRLSGGRIDPGNYDPLGRRYYVGLGLSF